MHNASTSRHHEIGRRLLPLAAAAWLGPLSGCAVLARATEPEAPRLPPGFADTLRTERVAEGARLLTIVNVAAPWRAYVLDVDTRCAVARAAKGSATAVGRSTPSSLLAGLPAGSHAIAAINGDFFLFTPPGVPTNLHVEGGVLIAGPAMKPVFISDGARGYTMDTVRTEGMIAGRTVTVAVEAWNRPAPARTGIVDGKWGAPFDSTMRGAIVQRLEPLDGPGAGGTKVAGRYIVRPGSIADLARGDTLLLHLPASAAAPAVGDTVRLSVGLRGPGLEIREAVGGRPLLVADSAVTGDVDTEGNAGFRGLNPRSAVGMNRDGTRMWYAVIDGRRKDYSMGMTLRQTAELMRALGATRALNLDGGGSSALALRDPATGRVRVANKPSDPVERPVGNAIAIEATCGR